ILGGWFFLITHTNLNFIVMRGFLGIINKFFIWGYFVVIAWLGMIFTYKPTSDITAAKIYGFLIVNVKQFFNPRGRG
ncbi:hypothetical protein, partial [Enterobacter intestinihominis]